MPTGPRQEILDVENGDHRRLITPTFLNLLVIPVAYSFVDGFEEWLKGLFRRRWWQAPKDKSAILGMNPRGTCGESHGVIFAVARRFARGWCWHFGTVTSDRFYPSGGPVKTRLCRAALSDTAAMSSGML